MRRFGVGLATVALCACTSIRPVAVLDHRFDAPQAGSLLHVEAERCRPFLFGFIPLKRPFWTEDVIGEATGNPKATLYGLTVDARRTGWLFGSTQCVRVAGWADSVEVRTSPGGPASAPEGPPKVETTPRMSDPVGALLLALHAELGTSWPRSDAAVQRNRKQAEAALEEGWSLAELLEALAAVRKMSPADAGLHWLLRDARAWLRHRGDG